MVKGNIIEVLAKPNTREFAVCLSKTECFRLELGRRLSPMEVDEYSRVTDIDLNRL